MGQLVRFVEHRRRVLLLHFSRSELNSLLGLYSSRVIKGEWRDYAISHEPNMARFSIYRNSQDRPLFTITKVASDNKAMPQRVGQSRFVLANGHQCLRQGSSLRDVLSVFEQPLRLISR